MRAPLHLMRCTHCKLLQLKHTVDPSIMYTDGYGYASGVNEQMVAHLTDLVDFVAARYDVQPFDPVLDIACNDGTLLRAWEPYKVVRYGVDPVASFVKGCHINRRYFEAGVYRNMKVITSVAVLYDLDNPRAFVQGIADALTPDGVWVVEVQYAGEIFEGKWDQICHEHLCYYGLSHLLLLAHAAGLFFDYAEVNPSNGGSLRVCFTKKASKRPLRGFGIMRDEDRWDVRRLPEMIGRSADAIAQAVRREDLVYILGASTKGNVIVQTAHLRHGDIMAALDRNPTKVGRLLPGTDIPIVSDVGFAAEPNAAFLVLPYHFRRSILKRHAPGKFLFPLPTVSTVCV
jgi:SAM-dependent methyltransferase